MDLVFEHERARRLRLDMQSWAWIIYSQPRILHKRILGLPTCHHLTVKADCKDGLKLPFGVKALKPPSNHDAFSAPASYAQRYSGQREAVAQEIRI